MNFIKQIINNKQHPLWVLLQQFLVRGIIALKFIIIARILGPDSVGIITVSLVCLALVEGLTDLGLLQAIVSTKVEMTNKQKHATWTLQFIRGVIISLFLISLTPLLSKIFNIDGSELAIYLIAIIPILKNASSIGIYLEQRLKNFKVISILQFLTSFIDFTLTVIFIYIYKSPYAAIFATVISEACKMFLSHYMLKTNIIFCWDFKSIKDITKYGKWIWANSVSTLLFSQLDKILTSRFLGTTTLGLYQMSQKFTQMGIYDLSFAFGQYYFPVISKSNREQGNLPQDLFGYFYSITFKISFVILAFLYLNANLLIGIVLGNEWIRMVPIFKLMLISAFLAAIVNVCIVYLRAIGKPQVVTIISYIQLSVVIILSVLGIKLYGVTGLVLSNIAGYALTNILLIYFTFKTFIGWKIKILKNFFVYSSMLLFYILIYYFIKIDTYIFILTTVFLIVVLLTDKNIKTISKK